MKVEITNTEPGTTIHHTNKKNTIMNTIKNIIIAAIIFTGMSFSAKAFATPVEGVTTTGTTDLSATIPEFIVLHYYSTVAMDFATPTAESLDEGKLELDADWKGSTTGNELNTKNLMKADLELDNTKTTVTLKNVWAVRGFSKNGNAKISIALASGHDKMKKENSEIVVSNVKVSDNTSTSAEITTSLKGIAKAKATVGSVEMDLDFTNTTIAGNHTGAKYTLTASTI